MNTSLDEESAVPEGSESDDDDVADEESEDDNGQLRFGMESLQQRMYDKGSVASVFARRVTQEREGGSPINHDFLKPSRTYSAGVKTRIRMRSYTGHVRLERISL